MFNSRNTEYANPIQFLLNLNNELCGFFNVQNSFKRDYVLKIQFDVQNFTLLGKNFLPIKYLNGDHSIYQDNLFLYRKKDEN